MNDTSSTPKDPNKDTAAHKLPKKKSPRCPSMPLAEALERALRVYEKEARHEAPADVVAQDVGYKDSRSGAAAQTLASMSYYGLLVRPSDGKLAVAKEVEEYKFTPQESMKQELLKKWLLTPAIYAELLNKYNTGLPSDATLKFDFIQKGFNAKVADAYVSAFRQSVDLVKYYETSSSENVEKQSSSSSENPRQQSSMSSPVGNATTANNPIHVASFPDTAGHDSIPVRLPGGRKAILIIPSPFYEADKARIKSHIDNIYADEEHEEDFSDLV